MSTTKPIESPDVLLAAWSGAHVCVSEDEKWMDGMRIQLVNRRSFVAVVAMAEVVAMPRLCC